MKGLTYGSSYIHIIKFVICVKLYKLILLSVSGDLCYQKLLVFYIFISFVISRLAPDWLFPTTSTSDSINDIYSCHLGLSESIHLLLIDSIFALEKPIPVVPASYLR